MRTKTLFKSLQYNKKKNKTKKTNIQRTKEERKKTIKNNELKKMNQKEKQKYRSNIGKRKKIDMKSGTYFETWW